MNQLDKQGYYLSELGNLIVYYGLGANEYHPDMYYYEVYKKMCNDRPEQWNAILTTEKTLDILNKTLEFEYLGEL